MFGGSTAPDLNGFQTIGDLPVTQARKFLVNFHTEMLMICSDLNSEWVTARRRVVEHHLFSTCTDQSPTRLLCPNRN